MSASEPLTAAELDAARVDLFRATGSAAGALRDEYDRGLRYRAALGRLADAVNLHLSFPDSKHTATRVREGLAMAAALDADDPSRLSMAIWSATSGGSNYGTPEERRARLAELRARKAADLERSEGHSIDGPEDLREFWSARVAALTDELGRIDTALGGAR